MALRASEAFRGRDGALGQDGRDEFTIHVFGNPKPTDQGGDNADDVVVASIFALNQFALLSSTGNVFSNLDRRWVGPGHWEFTAHYKPYNFSRQTNDASFSFQVGGATQHISHSKATKIYTPTGGQEYDHHGAINVGDDGSVTGLDIEVGSYSFKTTFYIEPAKMTTDYLEELKHSVPKTNSDVVVIDVDGVMQTYQPGELLLRGADGQKRVGFGDWELSLGWASSPNLSDLVIAPNDAGEAGADSIVVSEKKGWEYLWVYYGPDVNSDNTATIRKPLGAYVEKVYDDTALSGILPETKFGLGNTQKWINFEPTGGGQ